MDLQTERQLSARIDRVDVENFGGDSAKNVYDVRSWGNRWSGDATFAAHTLIDAKANLIRKLLTSVKPREHGGAILRRCWKQQNKEQDERATDAEDFRHARYPRACDYLGGI